MSFFDKFPLINYGGHNVRNLLAKADLTNQTRKNSTIFLPYTMTGDDRADVLSHKYYDDSNYDWLIWMVNRVVDPYYDMTLSDDDFNKFIRGKYGTVESSQRKIKFYRNSWVEDNQSLSVAQYDALVSELKKYYNPILDENLIIVGYSRKRKDWIVNTNSIIQLTLEITSGTFLKGEEVRLADNGYAFVEYTSNTNMTIHHINGSFDEELVITGQESGAVAEIVSVDNTVNNIPLGEAAYWTPVSFFDYESEQNLYRKEIKLLDNRMKEKVESELKRAMNRK